MIKKHNIVNGNGAVHVTKTTTDKSSDSLLKYSITKHTKNTATSS